MKTPDFEGLLRALTVGEVEFVLVGGYSAMLHGSSLMTRDVDVVCPMSLENVHRLSAQLFTRQDAERDDWKNLYLKTDLGVLDCLSEVKGLGDYDACRQRSIRIELGDLLIRGLSLDALIEAKRAMGRPRDLHTAEELEMIRTRQ